MFEHRSSDSPYIQFLWRFAADTSGTYTHNATEYWSFFFKLEAGTLHAHVSGPATLSQKLPYIAGGEYWGIVLKAHVFMPSLAKKDILNLNLELPTDDAQSFMLNGEWFAMPSYETAELLIGQLAQKHAIIASQVVAKALDGTTWMAQRTLQRHIAQATGLTRQRVQTIQRARTAFVLLQKGKTIAEVVASAGYTDQSHLTKSLRVLAGQTPAQILAGYKPQ